MTDKQSRRTAGNKKLVFELPASVGNHFQGTRPSCWLLGAALLALCPLTALARTEQQATTPSRLVQHGGTSGGHRNTIASLSQPGQRAFGPLFAGASRQAAAGPFPAGARWESIGPNGYLAATQRTYNGDQPINGRVNDAAFDPKKAGTYYIATGGGGVWRTTDAGNTWTPLTETQDTLSTGCMTMDPTNSDVLYVGTGDFDGSEGLTVGLLKTVNASAATPTFTTVGTAEFGKFHVSHILVDPANPQIVTVSTGRSASFFGQVWRSTDGGASWNAVVTTPAVWCDLAMGAALPDGRRAYYASGFRDTGNRVVFRSVDQGASWAQIKDFGVVGEAAMPDTSSLITLGASLTDPSVVYSLVGRTGGASLMKSSDTGDTWTDISANFPTPADNFKQAFYNLRLNVSTAKDAQGNNQDILYVGAIDLVRGRVAAGSVTWSSPGQTLTDNALFHCDEHRTAINPANPNQILICCDGGVYNLVYNPADDTSQITSLNANLGITQLYDGAYHPTNAGIVLGGAQDNGSMLSKGDFKSWVGVNAGDGGYCTINPMAPDHQLTSVQNLGGLRITPDSYATATEAQPTIGGDLVRFIAPIVLDPTQPNIDYFGTNFLNSVDTNTGIIAPHIGNMQLSAAGKISAIAVAPSDGKRIYTGSTQGELWMSMDKGLTFTQINTAGADGLTALPTGEINYILVNPTDPNMIYVAIGGAGANGVYRSTSTTAGAARTFTQLNGTAATALPDVAVNTLAFDFRDATLNTIYAGTDAGAFATSDGGATWADVSRPFGLPRIKVTNLEAVRGTGYLMAATFGRGFWRLSLTGMPIVTPPPVQTTFAAPADLGAIAGNGKIDLVFKPVVGATGYNIKRSNTSGGPYTTLATVTTTTYEDKGVPNDIFLFYVVSALQGATESPNSNEASIAPAQIPAPPANIKAAGGDKMVTVSWDPSPGADFYAVSRTTNPQADDFDQVANNLTNTNFVDTDVVNGQTYLYTVVAYNNRGRNSSPGGEIVAVTPGGTSNSISGVVTSTGNGAVMPLPGIQVQLQFMPSGKATDLPVGQETATMPSADMMAMTDAAGHYAFNKLVDGNYTIIVLPTAGQAAVPALTRTLDFHVNNGQVTDANFSLTPPGNFTQGLSMISLPYDYSGTTIDSGLALGLMPATAGGPLPIATYDTPNNNYLYYPNLPGGSGRQTLPGRGYWVFKTSNAPLTMPGKPVASPFTLTLSPGWNQIGDPFTNSVNVKDLMFSFPFAVDDLRANDETTEMNAVGTGLIGSMVFSYDPAQNKYVPVDTLQPFQGYWIYLSPANANGQTANMTFRNDTNE